MNEFSNLHQYLDTKDFLHLVDKIIKLSAAIWKQNNEFI